MTRRPLRAWLALAVLGPALAVSAVTALLVVPRARDAAEEVAVRLHRETGRRVRAEILPLLDVPHAANAANAELLRAAPLPDDAAWRRHLWRQLRETPEVGYLQIGWAADGGFVGVERAVDGFVTEVSDAERTGKGVWALDGRGEPVGERRTFVAGYDARTRPWFRAAIAAHGPTWSPIYQFSARDRVRLGITAVLPVTDADGPVAVLGADLVLSQLSDRLADHDLGAGSRLVLTERDGTLVASSGAVEPFRVDADGTARRVSGAACGDPTVESAVRLAEGPDGSFADLAGETALHGDGAWVFATPLGDGRGLDWVLVLAVPEGDVLPSLPAQARAGALVALLALAVGVAGSLALADRLTRPLRDLTDAAHELARGRFDVPLPPGTTAETAALVAAFERMRAELARSLAAAESARRTAVAADRQKTTFLHGMSHELRTPLTAILGYTDLLLDDTPADTEPHRDLQRIRGAAQHLLSLINGVLDLARVESGQLSVTLEPTDVAALAREVADELRPVAAAAGNTLSAEGDPAVVTTDRGKLRQILVNLVGNAVKFTDGGAVRVAVAVEPGGVRIDVVDAGIGFEPELAEQLFEPYHRAPNASGRVGTGLGLALVRRLAEALGGTVTAAGAPGRGSTFTVRLPGDPPPAA